ncbi:23S rRNA (adenine(1618)-N(6))-methyltransferase RlmF [Opitutus sp. ER46]|uniref:23S rRNA (adenine(1618)-N(6))-methyltransferase RlmF n=1 Tax=Opitutus sp. ER46 TaxID=2161864 RepID=UPI000D32114A|nr:23S rRNA (adenine(1618)-N(6))-methyltransferase RlmF [Opitutus sp. ER46]PTX94643.1 23S rRNA (adenine(1618)-N(6))-methyltransferase RlmF [Opitutus sp. ER46]
MNRTSANARPAAGLHPRNPHAGRYDFAALVQAVPALTGFVHSSPRGEPTIDFANPAAVLALNQALLRLHYGIKFWALPRGYLCPPIPGRADYLHHLADLLAEAAPEPSAAPPQPGVSILDVGVGASVVYPIIGVASYGWRFVGTDIDPVALEAARRIVVGNRTLGPRIELRRQPDPQQIFRGVVRPGDSFAACICNPPFHTSAAAAAAGTLRKLRNLTGERTPERVLNFGGQSHELWCAGGEVGFVLRMIAESVQFRTQCRWFTTLVSKRESLPPLRRALARVPPADVRTIELTQGQKKSRILAWRFGT